MHGAEYIISAGASIVAIAGMAYTAIAILLVRRFGLRREPAPKGTPPITVLKPISGLDAQLEENLRSFCAQRYPQFQVIFCFRANDDPAVPIARRVIEAFPHLDLALAIDDRFTAANPKVANLAAGLALAKHDVIVISDADVRVEPTFLSAIAAAFDDERVGAATCLYRGEAEPGIASELGALHINDVFAPSVLVATALEPLRFALGAAMAVRRSVLDEIGGLAMLGAHLGDDYILGASVAEHGYVVALPPHVVTCIVYEPDLATHVKHQVRWARTIRAQRPLGYAFLFVTLPFPFAFLAFAFGHWSAATALLLATAIVLRAVLHLTTVKVFNLRKGLGGLMLLGDVLEAFIWLSAFTGRSVDWRANRYDVGIGGRVQ